MIKRIFVSLTWLVFFLGVSGIFTTNVQAASNEAKVEIAVQQDISDKNLQYLIQNLDGTDNFLIDPVGGEFSLSNKDEKIIHFTFNTPGIYHYQIAPIALPEGVSLHDNQQFYELDIYVKYVEEQLTPFLIVRNSQEEKVDQIQFSSAITGSEKPPVNNLGNNSPNTTQKIKQYPKTAEKRNSFSLIGILVITGITLIYFGKKLRESSK
ncbi:LPXTG cell wall anchor domain-containing protein [Enterococcus asini]|uniref:LPXTG cell wall anchor domain-containing protein n=1 Tax=Enterococcus asini TaxID=57732 RepID=UPI00288DFFFB|nr:LPXTG cell wall anchor domain-containing protein [Enterococcus asini]MDT2756352.1 LPXTG cell wall anchor domain-containing protein [Enterococcus asini]